MTDAVAFPTTSALYLLWTRVWAEAGGRPVMEFIARADTAAVRRTVVAVGMGVACGYQSWLLSRFGLGAPIPPFGQFWIGASFVLLGLAIGATARWARWLWRAPVLALLFSVPTLYGAHALGLRGAPYAALILAAQMAAALLIGFLGDAIFPPCRGSRQSYTRPSGECNTSLRHRLVEAETELDRLDREREHRGDIGFGKRTEDRIIWAELLDLELQDIDERFHRICGTAGQDASRPSPTSHKSTDSSSR